MIRVELTEQELGTLMTALDAGVRAQGVRLCRPLAPILEKLEEAAETAEKEAGEATLP